jgi:hypothetical protein
MRRCTGDRVEQPRQDLVAIVNQQRHVVGDRRRGPSLVVLEAPADIARFRSIQMGYWLNDPINPL